MTMVTEALPEGVYRDDAGRLMRKRYEFRGFFNELGERWTDDMSGQKFESHDEIPHPVILALLTDSDEEVERKRLSAVRASADFWHPRLGWLRNGRKKETEWPENLGSSVIKRERRFQPVPVEDDEPEMVTAGPKKEKSNHGA